jgi:hypothetical protein
VVGPHTNVNLLLQTTVARGVDQRQGEALTARGLAVSGCETVGDFARLSFQEQIELVAQDLKTDFWHEDSRVIAN